MAESYVIDIQSVSKKKKIQGDTHWVLEDIRLGVKKGELVLVVGKEGSGKKQLMRLAAGLLQPDQGKIFFNNQPMNRIDGEEVIELRRKELGLVYKEPELFEQLSLRQNIEFVLKQAGKMPPERHASQCELLMKICGIQAFANAFPAEVTFAIQKRTVLARALANFPTLILLEEPTFGLDKTTAGELLHIVRSWVLENKCSALISSTDSFAEPFADSIVYLEDGVIQQKLDARHQEGEASLRSVDSGLFVVDHDLKFTVFNRQAERLLGFREDEVLGSELLSVLSFYDKQKKQLAAEEVPFTQIVQQESNLCEQELYIKDKYGQTVFFTTRVEPRYGQQNQVNGAVMTFKDVSTEKELDRMKSDFAAIAAHELRTPLTSIQGSLDIYMASNEGRIPPNDKMLLDNMKSSITRLRLLTENLIRISRIEQDTLVIKAKDTLWNQFVRSAMSEHEKAAGEKGLTLSFHQHQDKDVLVSCDQLAMREVLDNLLRNAFDHTPEGGKVTVFTDYNAEKKRIVTSIKDTGQGINTEELAHLFTKFYRAKKERSYTDMHLGLGLYISRMLVEYHGGEIMAESHPGKGTTFSFWLAKKEETV